MRKRPVKTPVPKPKVRGYIFRYWDGERNRAIDAFKIMLELKGKLGGELINAKLEAFAAAETPGQVQEDDITTAFMLIEMTRKMFSIKEYDEDSEGKSTGLTDLEVLEVFGNFMVMVSDVKKDTELMPI